MKAKIFTYSILLCIFCFLFCGGVVSTAQANCINTNPCTQNGYFIQIIGADPGSTVVQPKLITVIASHPSGIREVRFQVNALIVKIDSSAPYTHTYTSGFGSQRLGVKVCAYGSVCQYSANWVWFVAGAGPFGDPILRGREAGSSDSFSSGTLQIERGKRIEFFFHGPGADGCKILPTIPYDIGNGGPVGSNIGANDDTNVDTLYTLSCWQGAVFKEDHLWGRVFDPITLDIKARPISGGSYSNGPITIPYNTQAQVQWSSSGASNCNISSIGSNQGTSGTKTTSLLTSNTTFTLTCFNSTVTETDTVTVNVDPPSAPGLSFSAASTSIAYDTATTLSWTPSGLVTSCTATGDWSGSKSISGGSQSTGSLTSNKTYRLQCSGPGGDSPLRTVTVSVAAPPPPTLTFTVTVRKGESPPGPLHRNLYVLSDVKLPVVSDPPPILLDPDQSPVAVQLVISPEVVHRRVVAVS